MNGWAARGGLGFGSDKLLVLPLPPSRRVDPSRQVPMVRHEGAGPKGHPADGGGCCLPALRGQVKKPSRAVQFRLTKKRCHELWSKIVRRRDGCCILCGTTETLQAHHWIVHAGSSLGTRFLLNNGVALCYPCHIFKVHGRGDAFYFDQIKDHMTRQFVTEAEYDEIKSIGRSPVQFSLEELEQIEARLKTVWGE